MNIHEALEYIFEGDDMIYFGATSDVSINHMFTEEGLIATLNTILDVNNNDNVKLKSLLERLFIKFKSLDVSYGLLEIDKSLELQPVVHLYYKLGLITTEDAVLASLQISNDKYVDVVTMYQGYLIGFLIYRLFE